MKESLQPGLEHTLSFVVPGAKCVPALYPEAPEFQQMPEVLATGYMVGLLEWACVRTINPHLDWPHEQSLGTHIEVSHVAATPPGLTVTATARLLEVDGRRLTFAVEAHDGVDPITRGRHERRLIDRARFVAKVAHKSPAVPAPVRIRDLDHLVLRVVDLARMLHFYRDVLGCPVVREQTALGLFQLRAGRSLIDLIPVAGALGRQGGAPPGVEGRNVDHFCLRVHPFDAGTIRAYLAAHGFDPGEVKLRNGADGTGPSFYVRDPEGNTVELKGAPGGE